MNGYKGYMRRITRNEWRGLGGFTSNITARKFISGRWFYYRID